MTSADLNGPALAMLDVGDVPSGLLALDLLVKEALVHVASAGTVQDGHYLILFGGEVEPVQRAYDRAVESVGHALCDAVLLPWAEERIAPSILDGTLRKTKHGDTAGVLQNGSPPTLLRAVDAALKGALVELVQLRIGDGLGGRAIATLWGETHDVEAAIELATSAAHRGTSDGWSTMAIRNASPELINALANGTRFFGEWRG